MDHAPRDADWAKIGLRPSPAAPPSPSRSTGSPDTRSAPTRGLGSESPPDLDRQARPIHGHDSVTVTDQTLRLDRTQPQPLHWREGAGGAFASLLARPARSTPRNESKTVVKTG